MAAIARTLKQIGLYDTLHFGALSDVFAVWNSRMEGRRELSELSDRMIVDIGLDPDAVKVEIAKPFWRA